MNEEDTWIPPEPTDADFDLLQRIAGERGALEAAQSHPASVHAKDVTSAPVVARNRTEETFSASIAASGRAEGVSCASDPAKPGALDVFFDGR